MFDDELRGWCNECAAVRDAGEGSFEGELYCEVCGELMKATSKITASDLAAGRFMDWMRKVMAEGKWGPSPGGAAGMLKCGRATIDDLARRGVLERSEYNAEGHHVIMISERSIQRAQENKRQTGRWTGLPPGFNPDDYEDE